MDDTGELVKAIGYNPNCGQAGATEFININKFHHDEMGIYMITGTGKSFLMRDLVLHYQGVRVIVFPTLCLMEQYYISYLRDRRDIQIVWECTADDYHLNHSYSNEDSIGDDKIILTTYNSLGRRKWKRNERFDLTVFDEAHHIGSDGMMRYFDP